MGIKSKFRKARDDFKLAHIAWLFAGIILTLVFNWIVYKEPKRITAPGVSALVSISAFLLALWSAFKVNKWLNSKVNDAAFEKTQKLMHETEELTMNLIPVINHLTFVNRDKLKLIDEESINEIIKKHRDKLSEANELLNVQCARVDFLSKTLSQWNVELTEKGFKIHNDLTREIIFLTQCIRGLLLTEAEYESNKRHLKTINQSIMRASAIINELRDNNYTSLFNFNIPSSVKKDS